MPAKKPARWLEYQPVDDLRPAAANPKGHDLPGIEASMKRFGYSEPIVIDERTGRLVSGHGRLATLAAGQEAGETPPEGVEVDAEGRWAAPVVRGWRSASDAEADLHLVAVNQLTIAGGWGDVGQLVEMLTTADDLAGTGFSPEGVQDLVAMLDAAAPTDEPAAPPDPDEDNVEPPAAPVTQAGDVWVLGPHRVMCGSSRDPGHVDRLLAGAVVNVAFTSPPYADRRKYDDSTEFRPIPPEDYVAWFAPVAANVAAHLAGDGSWFVNIKAGGEGLDTHLYVLDLVLAHAREWGWHYATEFCWERNGVPKQVVKRFKNQFEPVHQFARGEWKMRPDAVRHASENVPVPIGVGAGDTSWNPKSALSNAAAQGSPGHEWFRDRVGPGMAYPGNRLPSFSGSHEATGHGAAFPVGLPEWFVKAYTDPGDTVFDPFMGSGSTLLAAHRQDRVGYGMEISPAYCDVICRRYQEHTGETPVLESTGEPHDFTAALPEAP